MIRKAHGGVTAARALLGPAEGLVLPVLALPFDDGCAALTEADAGRDGPNHFGQSTVRVVSERKRILMLGQWALYSVTHFQTVGTADAGSRNPQN